MEGFGVV